MCTCQCCTSTPIKIDYKVTVQPMNVFLQHVLEYLTTELVKSTLQSSICQDSSDEVLYRK